MVISTCAQYSNIFQGRLSKRARLKHSSKMAAYVLNASNMSGFDLIFRENDVIRQAEAIAFNFLIYPFIILIFFLVVGLICNSVVAYIFVFKWAKSKTCIFILTLCMLDLISCCLNMPMDIAILYNPLTFDHHYLCLMSRYITYVVSASYSFVLVATALDRYIMVCKPLTSLTMSRKYAVKVCVGSVIAAAISQFPAVFIYGTHSLPIRHPTNASIVIYGSTCLIADKANPLVTKGFYLFLFAGHIVIFISLLIIYVLIGRGLYISTQIGLLRRMSGSKTRLFKESIYSAMTGVMPHSALCASRSRPRSVDIGSHIELSTVHKNGGSRNTSSNHAYISEIDLTSMRNERFLKTVSETTKSRYSKKRRSHRFGSLPIEIERASMRKGNDNDTIKEHNNSRIASTLRINATSQTQYDVTSLNVDLSYRRARSLHNLYRLSADYVTRATPGIKELSLRQNTLIMRMVTFTFMLSYLPFLVIVTIRYTDRSIPNSLPFINRVLYEVFIRSYYFNSITRPFIYITMNNEYRKTVWNLLCRCGFR